MARVEIAAPDASEAFDSRPEPANLLNMAIRRRRETNEIARGQTCAPVVLSTKAAGAVLPASSSP